MGYGDRSSPHGLCRDVAGFGFDGGEDAVSFAAGDIEVGGF